MYQGHLGNNTNDCIVSKMAGNLVMYLYKCAEHNNKVINVARSKIKHPKPNYIKLPFDLYYFMTLSNNLDTEQKYRNENNCF